MSATVTITVTPAQVKAIMLGVLLRIQECERFLGINEDDNAYWIAQLDLARAAYDLVRKA